MPKRILFVCLGNICRSPSAEAVMTHLIADEGLDDQIEVDSAGTGSWHVGERADARMRAAARQRGIPLTSISRQVDAETDFEAFDYIVAMDPTNYRDLQQLDEAGLLGPKLLRMTDFCTEHEISEVPDPYYGGPRGFDQVLDILDDACHGLLLKVKADLQAEEA